VQSMSLQLAPILVERAPRAAKLDTGA